MHFHTDFHTDYDKVMFQSCIIYMVIHVLYSCEVNPESLQS